MSIFITARSSIHPTAPRARRANMPRKEFFLFHSRWDIKFERTHYIEKMAFQGQINLNLIFQICFKCLGFPHVEEGNVRVEFLQYHAKDNKLILDGLGWHLLSVEENWVIKSRRHGKIENVINVFIFSFFIPANPKDWSDHALWWPARNIWLTRTRSTLDQVGLHADALLHFTPMHKILRVQVRIGFVGARQKAFN